MAYILFVISAWNTTHVSFQEFNSLTACREAATEIRRQAESIEAHRIETLRMSCVKKGGK